MSSSFPILLSGLVLLALAAVPLVAACARLTRRVVGEGRPFLASCVGLFVFCLSVVLVSQVLGVAGLYSRFPFVVAAWIWSLLVWIGSGYLPRLAEVPWAAAGTDETAATTLGDGVGAAQGEQAPATRDWLRILTWTVFSGIVATAFVAAIAAPSNGADAVNYHLPDIANWIRNHSFNQIQQYQLGVYQNAYPMNAETIAAFFVVPFGRDWLVNLGTLVQFSFVVAAVGSLVEHVGHASGRSVRSIGAMSCGLAVATMPIVATSHVGSVGSDLLPLAAVVVCILFIDRWRRTERPIDAVVVALSLGLAFGSKFTTVIYVPLLALSFVALMLWRRKWLQALVVVPLAFALPAAYWYVRNVVVVGNPMWPFEFLGLPTGFVRDTADRDSMLKWFAADGPAAVLKAGLYYCLAGFGVTGVVVLGFPNLWRALRGDRARLWFFLAVPLLAVPMLWTQDWTGGRGGFNAPATARYVSATFAVLAAVAVGRALVGRRPRAWCWGLLGVVAANAAVAFLAPTVPSMRVATSALLAGLGAGALALVWQLAGRPLEAHARAFAVVAAALLLVVVGLAALRWDRNWYRANAEPGRAELYRAVQDLPVRGARIAVAGVFHAYPLYGRDFSNEVFYVGDGPHVDPWTTGDADRWVAALKEACVDYVAVEADESHWLHPIPELEFVRDAPALQPVVVTAPEGAPGSHWAGLYKLENGCHA